MGLPVITGTNPTKINKFCEKLDIDIQTVESMDKKKDVRGHARLTLDKLSVKDLI